MFAQQLAHDTLNTALFDFTRRRVMDIKPSDRFAHYTSSDAVTKIIAGDDLGKHSLWLRSARLMNDSTEIGWGQRCLGDAFRNWRLHDRFKHVLCAIDPNLYDLTANTLTNEEDQLGDNTFALSLALHTGQECSIGKLSMWRAYGGDDNVCLIFNTAPFLNYQSAYELTLSPVMYGGSVEFAHEFEGVLYRIERNVSLLRSLDPEIVYVNLKRALDFSVVSTKHIGFHEETEWRVIHQHSEFRPDPPSIPDPGDPVRRIYQIPLENRQDANLWGAELGEVLDRLIIGPVRDVEGATKRYIELLGNAGVTNPEDRVGFCCIPYRR